jgi:hypothetical protein
VSFCPFGAGAGRKVRFAARESHQLSAISRQEILLGSIAEAGVLDFPEG